MTHDAPCPLTTCPPTSVPSPHLYSHLYSHLFPRLPPHQDPSNHRARDIEVWMRELERQMRIGLREVLRSTKDSLLTLPYEDWVLAWPGQCVLLMSSVLWAASLHAIWKVCVG